MERGRRPVLAMVEQDHGRIEIRHHALGDRIDGLETQSDWARLQAVEPVESTHIIGENTRAEIARLPWFSPPFCKGGRRMLASRSGLWVIVVNTHIRWPVPFQLDKAR